jgi:PAS domain S-box-containing protein
MHTLLDLGPVPLVATDLRGIIEYLNEAMAALIGRAPDQLLGTRFDEHFIEADRRRARDLLHLTLREKQVVGYELATCGDNGTLVSCSGRVFPDQDHRPHGMVVALLDVAERERLERKLLDTEAFSRGLVDAADGLMTIGADGLITDVSDQTCQSSGYTREELVGSEFTEYSTDGDRARHLLEQTFASGGLRDYVLPLTASDGTTRRVSFNTWVPDGPPAEARHMMAMARDVTAQVAEQEQTNQEGAYTRGLIEASADGLVAIGLRGDISDMNARMCELLKKDRDGLIGREFTHYFTDPGLATEMVQRALAGGKSVNYQLQLANDPDTIVSVNASVFHASSGETAGVFASARDISEQARLQEKISGEQAYNRALIESSAEAFFAISPEGIVTDVNALASVLTEYSRRHLVGRPFSELFADPESARRMVEEAFSRGHVADHELTLADGGRRRVVRFTAGVFRDQTDQPQGLLAVARDVSAQKEVENKLREQQLYTRSLIESNTDAMLATDASGRVTDANQRAQALAGLSRDALIGSHLSDLVTEPERVKDLVSQVLRDGHVFDAELVIPRPDGSSTVTSCNASTFTDGEGKLQGMLASARDITERKKLEEEQERMLDRARKLDEAKTDFVSRVSHELRSPLSGVLGYTELLRVGRPGQLNAEQRRVVDIIERNGKRLLAQIEDLLLLSRIEAGALRLALEPVDLAPLILGIHESYLPAIHAGGIECELDLDASIVLDADAAQLERLVANLVSNAVKFTPEGGHIRMSAHRDTDGVVIQVSDDGMGIPPGEQDQVFTRFFRSSLSAARETRGTGLGLFLVKRVAEDHGGTVTAESDPGLGTTLTVRLPIHQVDEPHQSAEEAMA